ncbi:MAG: hypothetical protein ABI895_26755 [Deltaproteobacteria bacterium]
MLALFKPTGSSRWWVALLGFASGYGTNAAAHREAAPAAVAAARPAVSSALGIGGAERSVLGEQVDVQSEAAAAALSGGTGLGGGILQPLPAL